MGGRTWQRAARIHHARSKTSWHSRVNFKDSWSRIIDQHQHGIDENRVVVHTIICRANNASHERSDSEGGRGGKPVPVHGVLNDKGIKATSRSGKKYNNKNTYRKASRTG